MADFDIDDLLEELPTLQGVSRFVAVVNNMHWFRSLGETPGENDRRIAEGYGPALGFPEAEPAFLFDWEDAADAAATGDMNSASWEAEEQLRAALTDDLLSVLDEDTFEMVMTHINESTIPAIEAAAEEAADYLRIDDGEFVRATTGAAVQAVHQAALVMLTGADDDHPFAIRFRLFERGRWPIGIMGASFLIY